jgi:ATP-dependent DNA helicase RecG
MNLAEERGLGMKTLRLLPDKLGLPRPKYSFEEPYLILTLYRSSAGLVRDIDQIVLGRLNEDEKNAIQFIATKESVTRQKLEEHLGFSERKAQRVIKKLMDENLLRSVGRGPATEYELI